MLCIFVSFLELACAGSNSSVSGNSRACGVKKGVLLSLPSCFRGNIEQYDVFETLPNIDYGMNLGFLAYSWSWEVGWSLRESLMYPGDIDAGLMSCIEAAVEPAPKCQMTV